MQELGGRGFRVEGRCEGAKIGARRCKDSCERVQGVEGGVRVREGCAVGSRNTLRALGGGLAPDKSDVWREVAKTCREISGDRL